MEPVEQALEEFFAATEAPGQDEAFVWRVIEAYERQTRFAALAWTGFKAGCAAVTCMAVLAALASLEPAAQAGVVEGIRAFVLVGGLGTAIAYAARSLSGGPMTSLALARAAA